ncbi:hypothetical protein PC128_g24491 [Phytophthora cactorum]|nr:hypothetical protein PC120_g25326 [Phytophthora cactorum]KAG3143964.1 hypothetical protein PC128_g24491 [Phytophthora cactorum]
MLQRATVASTCIRVTAEDDVALVEAAEETLKDEAVGRVAEVDDSATTDTKEEV